MYSIVRRRASWILAIGAVFLAGCPVFLPLEGWVFGGGKSDWAYSVQPLADGGFVAAGATRSYGASLHDGYLVRADADGRERWHKRFGGPRDDALYSVQVLADGGYILAGEYMWPIDEGREDVYLVRTDANGNEVWSNTYGGDEWDMGYAVAVVPTGGFAAVGHTTSFGATSVDGYLVRTDGDGNEVWARTYGGDANDYLFDLQYLAGGGFILVGTTIGDNDFDVLLIRTDADGVETWSRTYGGAEGDVGLAVRPTADGGFVVAGWTNSEGAGGVDAYLLRVDADGGEVWSHTWGGPDDDMFSGLAVLPGGGVAAAGRYAWPEDQGYDDFLLVRTDADGGEVWSNTFGGDSDETAEALQTLADGGFLLGGWTNSYGAGAWDAYVVRTDADGNAWDG